MTDTNESFNDMTSNDDDSKKSSLETKSTTEDPIMAMGDEEEKEDGAKNDNNDENNDNNDSTKQTNETPTTTRMVLNPYIAKKPRWWRNLCTKPTKPQRQAMQYLMETTDIVLPPFAYGTFLDWKTVYPEYHTTTTSTTDIWLEIGFGRGENLLALAHLNHHNNHNVLWVGAEIHRGGVGKACKRIQQGLEQNQYWTEYVRYTPERDPQYRQPQPQPQQRESSSGSTNSDSVPTTTTTTATTTDNKETAPSTSHDSETLPPPTTSITPSSPPHPPPYSNLRLSNSNGMKLLQHIPSHTVNTILITFPDPFPSHPPLRIVQTSTLMDIHRVLQQPKGGRLFLATDDFGFFQWTCQVVQQVNHGHHESWLFQVVEPCPDRSTWLPVISHYEQKGWEEGRTTHVACWNAV